LRKKPLSVLLVENEVDADRIVQELKRSCFRPSAKRVDSVQALNQALRAESWDVVLCDHELPNLSGKEALRITRGILGTDIPIIFVSGGIAKRRQSD
jgi:CheY-like chemotaxis protein